MKVGTKSDVFSVVVISLRLEMKPKNKKRHSQLNDLSCKLNIFQTAKKTPLIFHAQ